MGTAARQAWGSIGGVVASTGAGTVIYGWSASSEGWVLVGCAMFGVGLYGIVDSAHPCALGTNERPEDNCRAGSADLPTVPAEA